MTKAENVSSSEDDTWREAEELFSKMRPMIVKLAGEMLRFDSSVDLEDLMQQACLALREACLKYNRRRNGNGRTRMKKETYAYWYLQKFFHRLLDTDRVLYDVYDPDGNYQASFHGREYTRLKKTLPDRHTFQSRSVFVDLSGFRDDSDGRDAREEVFDAVFPDHFDDEEVGRLIFVITKRRK